ncbi:MAG: hypothetical protein HY909_28705 [Deltaproteobacteria bacterium]|nr:hypothetical protein [Deltaproteobacteria bacterium]
MISAEIAMLSGYALAVRAERIDADNWIDDFSQAPRPVAEALGLVASRQGELVMVRSHVPFSHFNMVMTLGCPAAPDDLAFDAIERFYSDGGVERHWILVNDYSQPPELAQQLAARGYEPDGAWERVVLQGVPDDRWTEHAQGCEIVTPANAEEWSRFLVDCYRMPPMLGEWLKALVGSRGWTHAIRWEGGHPQGKVSMARSLYQDTEGWAWLGIDAPVPGVMAPCFEDDQKVTATLLAHAAARGARAFVSDIEVPSPTRDSEAYRRWGQLGFAAVYLRKLYARTRRR